MTEQNLTPDADDTKGHFHRDDEDISDADDTEGHFHRDDEDISDADDTEGHRKL